MESRKIMTRKDLHVLKKFLAEFEERISEEEAKHLDEDGNFVIDYERMLVSNIIAEGYLHYSQVIEDISELLYMVSPMQLIVMKFGGNHLTDEGLGAIVDFNLDTPLLRDRLISLDVSNNKLPPSALIKLINLVERCPHLEKLNISYNFFKAIDVDKAFQELPSDKKHVVCFSRR